jgi:sulfate/thiosulfate transport system ATP-binding protein
VGVRHVHALAHPGMSFLLLTDGSPASLAALELGGQIARLAHARTTILALGQGERGGVSATALQEARERIGSGLPALEARGAGGDTGEAIAREVERQPYDLVVLASQLSSKLDLAEQVLQAGEHHLLLIPGAQAAPARALICVTAGEPGKEDVLFAGRLLRHLGAEATLLTVLPGDSGQPERRARAERFLEAGVRTLALLGVAARAVVRSGPVREQIVAEMTDAGHDLLVLGAPLARDDGREVLAGVVGQIVSGATDRPVLIVRSRYVSVPARLPVSRSALSIPN